MEGVSDRAAGLIAIFEVSLNSSWPKDSPRMDRSGFPEPAGLKIRKNQIKVFGQAPPPSKK